MNLQRFSLLSAFLFFCCTICLAQQPAYMPGQVLVSLQPGISPQPLSRRMQAEKIMLKTDAKKVSSLLNVWLLETKTGKEQEALEWLWRRPEVRFAQLNTLIDYREKPENKILPNDPLFAQQWQYVNTGANGGVPNADLDAELAWDITTGGLTPAGDTIVVAVVDGGIDLNHSDLMSNLWKNWAETPGDDIDNDNNGYVDDFRGWNVWASNDNILGLSTGHGTPVSAIIGAKGNNENGVTGVNWNVKIMFVAGGGNVANILPAYDYVLQARQRYNSSNGTSGAFVVAVNSSFGINYGQPAANPLWCAAIDSLGAAGILSVAATANIPVNVDEVGDMPTTCPNDHLIAVTSLTRQDQKAMNAAWGAVHIDLGAYGQEVFAASANNGYGSHSGTSFASPQVAGAVGLLYSAPCPNLIALAKTDPASAALWAKNLILNNATPNTALQNITLTGGRLNLGTLLQDYEDQCSPCPPPFALKTLDITDKSALIKWSEISDFQIVTLHWRPTGAPTWTSVAGVEDSYLLENLTACTEYEFALSALCSSGESSDWSIFSYFKTDGCCEPPASVWATSVEPTKATISWSNVTAANSYRLRIRPNGGNWTTHDVNTISLILQNLQPCTDHEVQVQTLCDADETIFSNPIFFKTTGCGACTDLPYCSAKGKDAEGEWIASVSIGDWQYSSGKSGSGYQDFATAQVSGPKLYADSLMSLTIVPGFSSLLYKEFFRIYVDYNLDGDFDDNGELAFDYGWATDATVYGQISVPGFQNGGLARMRIMMKYKGVNNLPPNPCETFDFGQVEDYCAELIPVTAASEDLKPDEPLLRIYPQPVSNTVRIELPDAEGGTWNIEVRDLIGRQLLHTVMPISQGIAHLETIDWPTGTYVVEAEKEGTVLRGIILKI